MVSQAESFLRVITQFLDMVWVPLTFVFIKKGCLLIVVKFFNKDLCVTLKTGTVVVNNPFLINILIEIM